MIIAPALRLTISQHQRLLNLILRQESFAVQQSFAPHCRPWTQSICSCLWSPRSVEGLSVFPQQGSCSAHFSDRCPQKTGGTQWRTLDFELGGGSCSDIGCSCPHHYVAV